MKNNNLLEKLYKYNFFYALYTIWFVFISFHFYYLAFKLNNNGMVNISELINVFKTKIIIDYLIIIIFPIFSYYFLCRKIVLAKPLLDNEKMQIKLALKGLGILVIIAFVFTFIFY